MKKHKLETIELKVYVIPWIVVSGIFLVSSFFMFQAIRNHYYDLKKVEAVKIAKSYAQNLSKFALGEEIIEDLLREKISVAAKTLALLEGNYSNDVMVDMADLLEMDEVDYYDEEGVLRYSNLPEVLGWQVYPGHPIDVFLKSEETLLVEHIREDVITGNSYQYGYFKLPEGGLIQVGLRADRVQRFKNQFSRSNLLAEMMLSEDALHIHLLDGSLTILETTKDLQGLCLGQEDPEIILHALANLEEYSFLAEDEDQLFYKVLVPIGEEDQEVYALAIGYSLEEASKNVAWMSFYAIGILALVYGVLLYTLGTTYRKNKNLQAVAYFDPLTALPNKAHLEEDLRVLTLGEDQGVLYLVNIVSFKWVNMTYGYTFGDQVLLALSKRLKSFERKEQTLYRFAVDRFVLHDGEKRSVEEVEAMAQAVVDAFKIPLMVEGIALHVSVKIGIVLVDATYEEVNGVLKDATVALTACKDLQKPYSIFNQGMYQRIQREEVLVKELRQAMESTRREDLYLEYQPIVSGETLKILSFEALARMRSKTFGRISPLEFIQVAEKNMLMVELGGYFLDCALDFLEKLQGAGYKDIKVALNISGIQLLQNGFTTMLLEKLDEKEISPHQLELEITESILLENFSLINSKLRRLSLAGVKVALDDFGTGYSSFLRLQELSIDTLKIDQTFIQSLREEDEETLTSDMIKMAHRFGLKVVGEGVETAFQRAYLKRFGCDALQGFLFSPSVKEDQALVLLEKTF